MKIALPWEREREGGGGDRQTDNQRERERDRQTDRQTDRDRDRDRASEVSVTKNTTYIILISHYQ